MPSRATSTPRRASSAPSADSFENGIGVVDVDQDLARAPRQPIEPLEHAPGAALRQVADVAGALLARHAQADHLVVASRTCRPPARRRPLHGLPHSRSSIAPSPGAYTGAAALSSSMTAPRCRRAPAHRGWANTARACSPPATRASVLLGALDRRRTAAIELDAAPIDAAKVAQHAEHGIAARQVGVGAVGAPDGPGARRFAQHVQPGGVVDLAVDQDDPAIAVSRSARPAADPDLPAVAPGYPAMR
jgi:hypothetical protein